MKKAPVKKAAPKKKAPVKKAAPKRIPQRASARRPAPKKPHDRKTAKGKPAPGNQQAPAEPPGQVQLELVSTTPIDAGIQDDRLLLPQHTCALVFNVSPQAIAKWKVKPRRRIGREQLYYLPDLSNYRDQQRDAKTETDLTKERARLAAAQADRTELEVATMRAELIPADDILAIWEPLIGAARTKILSIPSKIKVFMPKTTDKDLKKIKTLCYRILTELANADHLPGRTRRRKR